MENKSVLYIDYFDSYLNAIEWNIPKWLKFLIYKFLNYVGRIRKNDNYLCLCAEKGDVINERMLQKILDIMNEKDIDTIVCADALQRNELFMKWVNKNNCNVLDGSWLMKFLMCDILEKIAYIKNIRIDSMEVSVFVKNFSDYHIEEIKVIAKRCKVLNIITDNVRKFEYVEKLLNEECGVMVNITGNIEKSSKRADVIFNFDFAKDELDKCNMKKNSIVVQKDEEEYIRKDGIVIRFFKLNLPIRYDEKFARFNHFNEEILYESIVYYKNSFKNIMAILRRDNVNIRYFIGNNGKISFREFLV